jgi:hypothetical protein
LIGSGTKQEVWFNFVTINSGDDELLLLKGRKEEVQVTMINDGGEIRKFRKNSLSHI